ncbi:hypothetical protein EJ994_00015 [Maribacter sp. MJ134]|nr:hypothetical protein EJ994_00015 [Maribacter sp. MJ134]
MRGFAKRKSPMPLISVIPTTTKSRTATVRFPSRSYSGWQRFYNISVDQVINLDGELPKEVVIEDKQAQEQLKLMQELDEEERSMIFKMIDSFLTKKKFKDFFNKNVASL